MRSKDGGYYALKGFLYQFDKSIIEILDNPNNDVHIEDIEDINYNNYVLQIKHKETATYSHSKIKPAVIQLLKLFDSNRTKKMKLYCYFKNKELADWQLTIEELNNILLDDSIKFPTDLKIEFVKNFIIEFSTDYDSQFKITIERIKSGFACKDDPSAIITHAIIRSNLLDLVIKQNPKHRKVNKGELERFIENNNKIMLESAYSKYLGKGKYEKEINKKYFKFNKASIEKFDRLFIIEYDGSALAILNKIIQKLSNKYYISYDKGGMKSPPPYILIRGIQPENNLEIKKKLWDSNFRFNDGTNFHGDSFRLDQIKTHPQNKNDFRVKFINEENLEAVLKNIDFDEVFQFSIDSDFIHLSDSFKKIEITVDSLQQLLNIIS